MPSCFAEDTVSIPGNAAAIFRKRACKDVQKQNTWQVKIRKCIRTNKIGRSYIPNIKEIDDAE
jgi:hypothetical protein